MRFIVAMLACVGMNVTSVALADPPATTDSAAASAASTSTPTPSAPTAAAPAAMASAAVAPDDDPVTVKRLRAAGYRPVMQKGQKVWCREEADTGSRLTSHKTCGTAQDIDTNLKALQDTMRQSVSKQMNKTGS